MKCEICEATIEELEAHYKDKHPNRLHEVTVKPAEEPEPPAEPVLTN